MDSPVRKISLLTDTQMPYKMPSSYNVDSTTNIYKLFKIFQEEINEFRQACYDVEDMHDIDKKYGKNLDNYGTNFEIDRRGDSDLEYINKIKSFLYSRGSYGDEDTILRTMSSYFGLGAEDFGVATTDTRKIEVTFPGNITIEFAKELVKRVKAAGIRLELTPDKYWQDMNYEEGVGEKISDYTYKELERYKYERE
ncbi:MAG: hypothetical protein ACRCX2_13340 [Paraclostridium sp.]